MAGSLTEVLDGDPARRGAGHFRGVTTIVAKLFNIVGPDVAYFGQKDAQQAAVIGKMVRDLDFPLRVEVLPTVREERRPGDELPQRLPGAGRPRARGGPLAGAGRGRARGPRRLAAGRASTPPAASWPPPGSSPSTWRPATPRAWSRSTGWASARSWSPLAARVGAARLIDNVVISP